MTSLISIQNLCKSYQRGVETIQVLNNLSLEIQSGEFVAFMGPSGSGKTTLLNLIAGIDKPDSGSLIVADQELGSLGESEMAKWRARNIGFVFQFYNLIPVLSALENVALPLSLHDMPRKERLERAGFALEIVGLADRQSHFPSQLSGGQEQRVAIARALVSDPNIIIADEPTGDLDRKSAEEVLDLLARLNGEFEKTIVMVTHDQLASRHAKRVLHLDKGQLVSVETTGA